MIAMNRNGYLNSVEGNYFIKEMLLALHSRTYSFAYPIFFDEKYPIYRVGKLNNQ